MMLTNFFQRFVWKVWAPLTAGFICFLTGDILFAFFALKGMDFLDPLLDLQFALSYIFIAWGIFYQKELLS